jgi:hypothetical protein
MDNDIATRRQRLEALEDIDAAIEEKNRKETNRIAQAVGIGKDPRITRCRVMPGVMKLGQKFALSEATYQKTDDGSIRRLNPKSSRKQKYREEVLKRKAERERKRRVKEW